MVHEEKSGFKKINKAYRIIKQEVSLNRETFVLPYLFKATDPLSARLLSNA
jgi:hypothetical protein